MTAWLGIGCIAVVIVLLLLTICRAGYLSDAEIEKLIGREDISDVKH